jgi:hypothetical protein
MILDLILFGLTSGLLGLVLFPGAFDAMLPWGEDDW